MPCWSDCFVGGVVVEAGAVSWLMEATPSSGATVSSGEERGYCSSLLLRFLSSSFVFSVVSFYPSGLFLSFLPRFKLFLPLSLGLLVVLFCSVRSLLFRFFFFLSVFSSLLCWRWVVFIGQKEQGRPYCHPIAAHREQGFVALPW